MSTVKGTMATDRPERYAKQLVSHWAKRGPVTIEDGATVQRWESGQVIGCGQRVTSWRSRSASARTATSRTSPRW